ncbi:MAG: hypothetical protein AAGI03_01980 [Pseudomonadota bacterium]
MQGSDNQQRPLEFDGDDDDEEKDRLINSLQNQLIKEQDRRAEERFAWFAALNIIADLLVFPNLSTWSAPVSIAVIQILLLIVLGRKWGVDDIWTLTEKMIDKWDGKTGLR